MTNLFVFSTLFLAACGGGEGSGSTKGGEAGYKASMLTHAKDPVCGMSMAKHEVADTLHHKRQVYGFCAVHCKESFADDPAAYLD